MPPIGYRIRDGVRRVVAAREAGHSNILAVIERLGQPDEEVRLALSLLHSPKPHIDRDYRYIRYTEYPTQILGTEPPAVAVVPILNPTELSFLTPASAVLLR